jgi:hypothetical protein
VLDISIDPRLCVQTLNGMDAQLPFAVAKALNEVAVKFQADERDVIRSTMTIRRPWVLQGVKIDRQDFATKQKLSVRVHVEGDRDFLEKFEEGGTRGPRAGKRALSVPIGAKRSPQSIVPASLRPKALLRGGKELHGSGVTIIEGALNTVLIQKADGSGVILQRKGRKVALKKRHHGPLQKGQRRDPRMVVLFILRPRTPVPRSLRFGETAAKSFAANWPKAMTRWWNEAVRTAR